MSSTRIPAVDYLALDGGSDGSAAALVAHRCVTCGAHYFDRRNACASCGNDTFEPAVLSRHGTLKSYTIVHRSAPGVPTPFISAVVSMEGGGEVKATLRGVDPDPSRLTWRMPVELDTFVVATAEDGTEAVAFGFVPRRAAEGGGRHA